MEKVRVMSFRGLSVGALQAEVAKRAPAIIDYYRGKPFAFVVPWPQSEEDFAVLVARMKKIWKQREAEIVAESEEDVEKPPIKAG